jgi:FtsH-binding integral membrane protein
MFAPLAFVFFLGFKIHTMSMKAAQIAFWGFATLMGASLSYIFAVYTGADITRAFFITAATFGTMSLYGYTTKKDLSGFGSFLMMGVIGIIIASLVNFFFLQSSTFSYVVSVLSVLIFTGLVAYDTQKLKNMYYSVAGNAEALARMTIIGALDLYIDVIVIFQNVLHLTSND